jgi:hypothetical protein
MPVTDISQVTATLKRLVELAITPMPTVSTARPESVESASAAINIYCYHVSEDEHNRIRPRSGGGIETSPLTLQMHYIVTALMPVTSEFDTLTEQRLLGQAMKVLHDNPVIDDGTLIGPNRVLPEAIQGLGNHFEVSPVQTTPHESLDFWANQDRITAKPSAYYIVRPVEIVPERPRRVPGTVLSLGAFVAPKDLPSIGATESTLLYALPAALGGGQATLTASPAQVGPETADPTNIMRLKGNSLAKGTTQTLFLSNAGWALRYPGMQRIPVDLSLNPAWDVDVSAESVVVTLGDDLVFTLPDGSNDTASLYPGTYSASWQVSFPFQGPVEMKTIDQRSNSAPFTVVPRIISMVRNPGTGEMTLTFGGTWRLNRGDPPSGPAHEEPELDILLSVDGDGYARATSLAPGGFTITDHTLTYEPLPAHDASGLHAITVVVEGAPAQPLWVEIP